MSVYRKYTQVFDIVDANGESWQVTVDTRRKATKIRGPGTGKVRRGTPRGILYTSGAISELKGPSRISSAAA